MEKLLTRIPYIRSHRDDLKEFRRDMKQMAAPVIIEQAASVLMNMISTMIASQLGPAAISAIGSVNTITLLVIAVFSALSTGGTVAVAQYRGQKKREEVRKTVANGLAGTFVLALISVSLLLAFRRPLIRGLFRGAEQEVLELSMIYLRTICFYYLPFSITSMGMALLRGAGDVRNPMLVSLITNAVCLLISYPLIYGFASPEAGRGLGVRGAALAMVIAQTVGMALILWIIFTEKGRISIRPSMLLHPDFKILGNILFFGAPAGAEQVMFNGGKLLTQVFIMGMGTAAVAANTIVNSVSSLISVSGNSLSILATTMVGRLVGSDERLKARRWNFFIAAFSSLTFLLMMAVTLPLSGLLIRLFTQDPQTQEIAIKLLRIYILVIPLFHSASFNLPSGLRGAGDVTYTMTVSILSMWILRVGMSYVLAVVLKLGVYGIWFGMYLDWIARSAFFIPRSAGTKWLKHKRIS